MRYLTLLLICLAGTQIAMAQEPKPQQPTDPNAELKNVVMPQVRSQDTTIRRIMEELQKIQASDQSNSSAIQGLLQGREIDNITKYQLIRNNIVYASETYYLLNKKIIDLKSRTTTNNLDVFITSLNNPESKELGFSLSDRIVELVEKVVLKGKKDKNDDKSNKIVESTKSIIASPIFQSFTSLTPPLAIANSVMNFLHSVSVNNKEINQQTLKEFEKELNKYVVYYTALNDANNKFEYGLNFNKDQLNLLHDNLYDHIMFTASALKFNLPQRGNKSLGETLNDFFFDFKKEKVVLFFDDLENKYTKGKKVDYEALLRENPNLKEVNNQLEDLVLQTKRFENLYNEYFTLLDSYYGKVANALKIAQDNGLADKATIDAKQSEFRNLKDEAVKEIQASINIKELYNNTDKIKYRYRIF
ncbi:MAG: hypothetical protein H6Q26_2083 [Bacteroidetes bacterium]|uniref:hypothetical protein n=1 Tax=Chitinophaga TaxID=79328 RepID=UPI00117F83BC|nr:MULTISPECIES: hypothetical protein [Chitinophaga]MBP1651926.1 hypothetical protein [Bacteroidota bacterium]WPQ62398.1 hypothetical protein SIO70_28970 [Chitinophaga sancti]WPV66791.1 hypothetical protein QQL36_33905 [Chitinophaga sp. LS1]